MKRIHLHILFAILAFSSLTGCALYPVVQVAGGAMTGYDAVVIADDYIPRGHIEGGGRCLDNDKMLERRLRERLKIEGSIVSAHVFDANAYLVGQLPNRAQVDSTISTAKSVQGLKTITCKFYPPTTAREANADTELLKILALRLSETKRLESADLRVEVIQSNAILIGETSNYDQKTAAVAIASEVGGIKAVVDYITVAPQAVPANDNDEIAMK